VNNSSFPFLSRSDRITFINKIFPENDIRKNHEIYSQKGRIKNCPRKTSINLKKFIYDKSNVKRIDKFNDFKQKSIISRRKKKNEIDITKIIRKEILPSFLFTLSGISTNDFSIKLKYITSPSTSYISSLTEEQIYSHHCNTDSELNKNKYQYGIFRKENSSFIYGRDDEEISENHDDILDLVHTRNMLRGKKISKNNGKLTEPNGTKIFCKVSQKKKSSVHSPNLSLSSSLFCYTNRLEDNLFILHRLMNSKKRQQNDGRKDKKKRKKNDSLDNEIDEKVEKFLSKANELQRSRPDYACEIQSILRNVYDFLHYEYLHIDHLTSIFSTRDMTDSLSRFKYNLKEHDEFRDKIIDSNSISTSMSITKFHDYRFNRNHVQSSITYLKKKREILQIIKKIEIDESFPSSSSNKRQQKITNKDIIPPDLYKRVIKFLNDIDMCSCRGEDIKLSDYSINIAEINKKGRHVVSKTDRKINTKNKKSRDSSKSSSSDKVDSTIHTKCCVSNCDLSKDLKRNLYSEWLDKLKLKYTSIESGLTKEKTKMISIHRKHNFKVLLELEKKIEKYECKCPTNKKNGGFVPNIDLIKKGVSKKELLNIYTSNECIREVKLYKHQDCIDQSHKWCLDMIKLGDYDSDDDDSSSSSKRTVKISRPSNFVNLTPIFTSDMTSNIGNTHKNGVPSVFPFFSGNRRKSNCKASTTRSFVKPSKILNVCSYHLPIILSVWFLFNWKNNMKFNALNSLYILNPEESYRSHVTDISDHVLKSFLSHPHLIHNSIVDFEICSWVIEKWTKLFDDLIIKN